MLENRVESREISEICHHIHPDVSVMPHTHTHTHYYAVDVTGNTRTDTHKYFRQNIFGIHKIDEIIDADENVWNEPIDCAMPKNTV